MEISNIGTRIDHKIAQGKDWGPFPITLKNPDKTPVDITGFIFRGVIRKDSKAATPVTATITTTIVDAPNGVASFTLSNAVTAAIPCGDTIADPKSQYVWEYEMEDSLGHVRQLFYGEFKVLREITR